jgi:hypothetical protein
MFCNHCGQEIPDESSLCNHCGQPLGPVYPVSAPPGMGPGMAAAPSVYGVPARTDTKATISMVLGILSLFCFTVFTGIPAIVLGHMSRAEIKKSMGQLKGEGLALAGLITGYIGSSVVFILIIAAIAIPNLLRSRMAANEASAVGSIRTIVATASTYQQKNAQQSYPHTLDELRSAGIDAALASGSRNGYHFAYEPKFAEGGENVAGYVVTAVPNMFGSTGARSFCAGEDGVIHAAHAMKCSTDTDPVLE